MMAGIPVSVAIPVATWISYLVGLMVYRLYFSPVAHIPGPKIAAISFWYEFYWDVIKQGRYTWRIGEMHEKYGPIVRINPYEVHINDPDYYNEIYSGPGKRREKWAWSAGMFGNSSSFFGAVNHEEHRRLRAPLNPFFSKASVVKLQPMINKVVEKLCDRLEGFKGTQKPVNLRHAFAAVAMDVVTEYSFGTSYNCLDEPDFAPNWPDAVDSLSAQTHLNKQMPWILSLMRLTPLWIVERLNPHIMRLIRFQMDMAVQVSRQFAAKDQQQKQGEKEPDSSVSEEEEQQQQPEHPTIFSALLEPNALQPSERTIPHLVDEAQSVVAAGQVTTTHYLNTTTYHILTQPAILSRLQSELATLMPTRDSPLPPLAKLEQLPYLTAVILEGYRTSYGPTHRLQRVSPDAPLRYKSYTLPAGTPLSMTSLLIHDNPSLFPSPHTFDPSRWLAPGARETLSNYLVNFSRGTRACLGKELASAEIYVTLAAVLRRFELEVWGTEWEDVRVEHDFFNPQPRKGSVGLRVLVR